jgi:hypothetical protein
MYKDFAVQLHVFWTLVPGVNDHFQPLYLLNRPLIGPHGRSGRFEDEKKSRFSEKQNQILRSLTPYLGHCTDRATTVYSIIKIEMLLKSG